MIVSLGDSATWSPCSLLCTIPALSRGERVRDAEMGEETIRPAEGPRGRRARRQLAVAVAVVGLLLAVLAGLRQNVAGTPGVILAAALIPPAGFAAVVLLLGRRDSVPWLPSLGAFLWGGTAAPLAALALNDAALRALPQGLVTAVVGPLGEEVSKGGALAVVMLAWPGALCGVRDGIVYGALAGLGFAATENLGYYMIAAVQGGSPGLARALYVRGLLEGLNHAAFTAIIGAAVGHSRLRPAVWRSGLPVLAGGLAVAVAVHGAWNALASTAITTLLCNAPAQGAACAPAPRLLDLLVSVPVLVAAFIGPLAALLVTLALRDRR